MSIQKQYSCQKAARNWFLTHNLKNTGTRVIETDVYDHNLFFLDRQPIGPGCVLRFSFPLSAEEARGLGDLAAMRGDSRS